MRTLLVGMTVGLFTVLMCTACDGEEAEMDASTEVDGGSDADGGGVGDCTEQCIQAHLDCGGPGFFADWPWCPDYCEAATDEQVACLFEQACIDLGGHAMAGTFPCDVPEPPPCTERCIQAHLDCGAPDFFADTPWCPAYCDAADPAQVQCLFETDCADLAVHGMSRTFPCDVPEPMPPVDGGVDADGGMADGDGGVADGGVPSDAGSASDAGAAPDGGGA